MILQPYWLSAVPLVDIPAAPLNGETARADVAVIGGGYTGLSAARALGRAGASVIVLEAEDIGGGASSRNAGQVLTGLRLAPGTLVERYGESRARELFEASRGAMTSLEQLIRDEAIDCDLQRTGHLQAAWKRGHFEAFKQEQALLARVFDHPVELVARPDQRSELGSDRYHGLMLDQASMALQPAMYVRGLASSAVRSGARLVSRSRVTRVARAGPGWHVATANGGVDAGHVLIATNGYTTSVTPALRRRLVAVGSYIIATEPLTEAVAQRLLPGNRMVFDTKHFLYYFRLTSDRRLLFGGRAQFSAVTSATTQRAAGILRRAMMDVFPELSSTRIDYAWNGMVAFTRDELPHAGQLENVFYAAGYCGHGVAMATALGDAIGRRIAGESVRHPFFDGEFRPIPFNSIVSSLLPAAGAYFRIKDWIS